MIAARRAAHIQRGVAISPGSGLVALVGLAGLALLMLSLVPPSALAGRLLETAGETRSGPYTQDLYAHLGERLRLAAGLLLAGAAVLAPLRTTLDQMLLGAVEDLQAARVRPRLPRPSLEVALLMLLAVGLRLVFLGQPMRYDEAITYNEFASRPLYYGLSFYPEPNNHLLNTLLVHVTSGLLGPDPWALRLPALAAGVLLVPATYWLGALLHSHGAGLLAASLVAASSYLIEYSTNARGYTLQTLAFVVTFCLVIWARRRGSQTALLVAAVVAALGFWAVPTMLYGLAVIAAWLAAEVFFGARVPPGRASAADAAEATTSGAAHHGRSGASTSLRTDCMRPGWSHLLTAGLLLALLTCMLYLPVVVISGPERLVANPFVQPLGGSDLARDLSTSVARTWSFWIRDLPWPVSVLLIAGVFAHSGQELSRRRLPLAILAAGVCLALVVAQRVAPFERVWLFLLPLYFVLAGAGLARVSVPRWVGSTAAIGLACLLGAIVLRSGSILASRETGAFPDAAQVAQSLQGKLGPQDAVLTQLPASLPELQYYFRRDGLPLETLVRPPQQAQQVFVVATADQPNAVLEARFTHSAVYRLGAP